MPLYLSWWSADRSVEDNLRDLAGRPGAPLLTEGDLVLATEAESSERPAAVLHAIAAGKTRHHEIKGWIGHEPTRTLDRLTELRLVERMVPVTEDPRRTRRRLYRICDNFLAFHLGVLSRYRAEIDRGLGNSILPFLMEELDRHLGGPWEQMFRDHIRRECARGAMATGVVAIGPWWRQDGQDQIDAVGLAGRRRAVVLAGEAKWSKTIDARRILHRLQTKAASVADDPATLTYVLGARKTIRNAPGGTLTVTAADVFAQ